MTITETGLRCGLRTGFPRSPVCRGQGGAEAQVGAPVAGQCVVPLQNRYSFTDLSELTCRWQALAGEKVLATGESHVVAKPRSTVDASFPAIPGMDTLRLEFIHRDGRTVYVTSLRVKS